MVAAATPVVKAPRRSCSPIAPLSRYRLVVARHSMRSVPAHTRAPGARPLTLPAIHRHQPFRLSDRRLETSPHIAFALRALRMKLSVHTTQSSVLRSQPRKRPKLAHHGSHHRSSSVNNSVRRESERMHGRVPKKTILQIPRVRAACPMAAPPWENEHKPPHTPAKISNALS